MPPLGLNFGFLGGFGLFVRKLAAKAKRDSTRGSEASLAGSAVIGQVIGVHVIDRAKLQSDVTKEPEVAAAARSIRHRCIRDGAEGRGAQKVGLISANQRVSKIGKPLRAITQREPRAKHVGDVLARDTAGSGAIVHLVAADVSLDSEMMKLARGDRKIPAVQLQLLIGRQTAGRLIKCQVRVAAKDIHGKVLRGSDTK